MDYIKTKRFPRESRVHRDDLWNVNVSRPLWSVFLHLFGTFYPDYIVWQYLSEIDMDEVSVSKCGVIQDPDTRQRQREPVGEIGRLQDASPIMGRGNDLGAIVTDPRTHVPDALEALRPLGTQNQHNQEHPETLQHRGGQWLEPLLMSIWKQGANVKWRCNNRHNNAVFWWDSCHSSGSERDGAPSGPFLRLEWPPCWVSITFALAKCGFAIIASGGLLSFFYHYYVWQVKLVLHFTPTCISENRRWPRVTRDLC